jgi:hypothetical protein
MIKKIIIGIPNIPLILFITCYVIYNLWKHTGIVEMHLQSSFLTKEIKEHLELMFPKFLFRLTAILFWTFLIFKILL